MNVMVKSAEKKENSTVELMVEIGAEDFDAAVEKVYKQQRNKISVPGFRKGKAPRNIIEGMYGSGIFYEDAINNVYPDMLDKALEDQHLTSVGYPQPSIEKVGKDGLTLKIIITVEPEATIGEYKGLKAPRDVVSVTDEDVDAEMRPYINRATHLETVDREAKMDDTVVIDFEGFENGKPFEGGKGENYELKLGSHSFIEGFEDQLVGIKADEERDIDVTFPENYGEKKLAGKPVVFKVKCHEVKESVKPVLDDEFAKDVSEFDTLEEFKEDLRKTIEQRREDQAEKNFENALMKKLADNCTVEIPESMKEYRADQMIQDYANRIQSSGIGFDQYMQMMGLTKEKMRESAKEGAEAQIRTELALKAVAKKENIEVTEEDRSAEYEDLAKKYNIDVEKVKEVVKVDQLDEDILIRKATNFIIENAQVEEPSEKDEKEPVKEEQESAEEKKDAGEEKKDEKE